MTDWHDVRICWISAADGGRKAPPSGPIYATVARFIVADRFLSATFSSLNAKRRDIQVCRPVPVEPKFETVLPIVHRNG